MKDPFLIQTSDQKIKDRKIPNFSNRLEEGGYLPSEVPEKAALAPPVKKGRIYFFFIFVFVLMLILFFRLFWLQITKGEEYRNIAEGNRIRILPLKADRGLIYDRFNRPLVKNKANFSLTVIPGDLPKGEQEKKEVLEKLISFLEPEKKSLLELKEKVSGFSPSSYQETELLRNIDYQTAFDLVLKTNELPGFNLQIKAERQYLNVDVSHILGYTGKLSQEDLIQKSNYLMTDVIGKTGLEFYYEDLLKGKDGQKKIEVNSLGKEKKIISQVSAQTGKDLILSIDANLQSKVADILKKYLKLSNSMAGTVVVLNPQNGEVLALYSYPSYDNNSFIQGEIEDYLNDINDPLVFRAISGEYPSGSVIKPIIAAGALAEGIINEKTSIFSQGGFWVGKWFFADWKQGGHGPTDLIKALAESVNTFFYYLGGGYGDFQGLGEEKINYYAKLFGLNQKTGIDLPNENQGLVATPAWKQKVKGEIWYIGDTYHLSIGQGDLLVTPLQVANYMAVIANGGVLFKPRLVKEINDSETKKRTLISSEIIRKNFIDTKHLDLIKKGLRATVTQGSARRLSTLSVEIAGKTGTAQVGGNKNSHAWFSGFAPYNNPEIVVTVLIENGGEGSEIAVPAAQEIFKEYFSL
ncbi:MAG: penicillin-binding protein 2 [Patescibacteria group bacterium]|nr:penicillin-binding protein 2 [Patescibacteria group bacterium]